MIDHKNKFIFIHIGKTGGTSIEFALNENVQRCKIRHDNTEFEEKHWSPNQYLVKYPESKDYFKFAFVRNPWDLEVSLYEWYRLYYKINFSFESLLKNRAQKKRMGFYNYLFSRSEKRLVNFIGKFENLKDDFKKVCDRLNIKAELKHNNKTIHAHYTDYYNDLSKEIVRKAYAREIDCFNYRFEKTKTFYKFLNTSNINLWKNYQNDFDRRYLTFPEFREKPKKSLEYTCKIFNLIKGSNIVECGTGLTGDLSGNSMIYWIDKTDAKNIHCIDTNKSTINHVKKILKDNDRISYYENDCMNIVPSIKQIDLIYIDFWANDSVEREKKYLDLYLSSNKPKLILIDDTDHTTPWKHTKIIPKCLEDGYYIIYTGRQTLMIRSDIYTKVNSYIKDLFFN